MIPVTQKRSDDCFAACFASLLELPLTLFPHRPNDSDVEQMQRIQRWLGRVGYTAIEVPIRRNGRLSIPWAACEVPLYCMITADVKKHKNATHALVGKIDKKGVHIVHDPSPIPWNADELRILSVTFLIPLNPLLRA